MTEFAPVSFFQGQLSEAYTTREKRLLDELGKPRFGQMREVFDETMSEITEPGIFGYVPNESSRKKIKMGALSAAREFWVKKLEESALPSNIATFGRERITELTQQLADLAKPPKNLQP